MKKLFLFFLFKDLTIALDLAYGVAKKEGGRMLSVGL